MQVLIALAGIVIGALAGGAVTLVVSRQQWKRERAGQLMEDFFALAYVYLMRFHPFDGYRDKDVRLADLALKAAVLSLYAPNLVSGHADVLVLQLQRAARDFDPPEALPNRDVDTLIELSRKRTKIWNDYDHLLGNYEAAMRKARGLGDTTTTGYRMIGPVDTS